MTGRRGAAYIAGVLLAAFSAPPTDATPIDIPIVITGPSSPPPPLPPGECTLSLNPSAATITSNTPRGAVVSAIIATNCSKMPTFGPPNFDDGGLFSISGSNVIINPQGPGVAALAGTTQNATVVVSP